MWSGAPGHNFGMLEVPAVTFMTHCVRQEQAETGFIWLPFSTPTCFFITGDAVGAYRLFSLQMCCLIRTELKQAIFQQGQFKRLSPYQLSSHKLGENSTSGRPLPSPPARMDLGTWGRAKSHKAWLTKKQYLMNSCPWLPAILIGTVEPWHPAEPRE